MALFDEELSSCALCDGPFAPGEQPFATSDGELDGFDRYADAVFHWDCVARWPEREAFARAIFESERAALAQNPYWYAVYDDGDVLVTTNPNLDEPRANVMLAATGSLFEVPLAEWSRWLRGEGGPAPRHASEHAPLRRARAALTARLPTREAVLSSRA